LIQQAREKRRQKNLFKVMETTSMASFLREAKKSESKELVSNARSNFIDEKDEFGDFSSSKSVG
jgi:hypothetical protein